MVCISRRYGIYLFEHIFYGKLLKKNVIACNIIKFPVQIIPHIVLSFGEKKW